MLSLGARTLSPPAELEDRAERSQDSGPGDGSVRLTGGRVDNKTLGAVDVGGLDPEEACL